jgi:hypothetical protein
VSRCTKWRHTKTPSSAVEQLGSPPPPKRRRIAHSQADAGSSASAHPQLYAHSFEFDPSPPLHDVSAASSLLQPPGDAPTNAPSHLVDDVLRNFHARTHWTTDKSDNKDSEDTLEGDAVEAADSIGPKTDDFWNREDVDMEGDVDPREGIVSDWDILAEEFIVEAEELGKFERSLLHTP